MRLCFFWSDIGYIELSPRLLHPCPMFNDRGRRKEKETMKELESAIVHWPQTLLNLRKAHDIKGVRSFVTPHLSDTS